MSTMSLRDKRSGKRLTRILMTSGSGDVEGVAVKKYTMIHQYKSERYSQDCYSFLRRLFTFLGLVNYLCRYVEHHVDGENISKTTYVRCHDDSPLEANPDIRAIFPVTQGRDISLAFDSGPTSW